MPRLPIYLDNNATTRCDPRVVDAMLPFFTEVYGNTVSRSHPFGWAAEEAVEAARAHVAHLIGADAREIVWTSGATESNNLALAGVADAYVHKGGHIVTVATEHAAVLDTARSLQRQGKTITILGVDAQGLIHLDELRDALTNQTVLVSVMLAGNETGVLQPLAQIGELCRARGVLLHTDATQAVGKIPVNVEALGVDLLSLSAHKMYGPKGVGALYVRRRNPRVRLTEQMHGGGHERGMRSGTLNVPGIVGLGRAAEIAAQEMGEDAARTRPLRDRLEAGLLAAVPGSVVNGGTAPRLPNTLNMAFPNIEADALMAGLPHVALSSGSACSSASVAPSHVLKAMGLTDAAAHSSLRFGLSRWTTAEEIETVIADVGRVAARLRALTRAA